MKSYKDFRNRKFSGDKISVFDLDDTLVISKAKIKVYDKRTNKSFSLTPEEFNSYEKHDSHEVNFDEFHSLEILKAGELIDEYLKILKRAYKKKRAVGIVTARSNQKMVFDWLKDHVGFHVTKDLIFAVNDPIHRFSGTIAQRKEAAFKKLLDYGYREIEFYDDDLKNVKQIRNFLNNQAMSIKFKVIHVK